mmetsp:Transcript_29663/g.58749  ORF Transcript_29663/g.58749 Transcript_29663/m.58749 type:complete len:207 (-) Transcript_29663:309-929(-)
MTVRSARAPAFFLQYSRSNVEKLVMAAGCSAGSPFAPTKCPTACSNVLRTSSSTGGRSAGGRDVSIAWNWRGSRCVPPCSTTSRTDTDPPVLTISFAGSTLRSGKMCRVPPAEDHFQSTPAKGRGPSVPASSTVPHAPRAVDSIAPMYARRTSASAPDTVPLIPSAEIRTRPRSPRRRHSVLWWDTRDWTDTSAPVAARTSSGKYL